LRKSGDVVAVKVQRPFLRQIYDQDLQFLTKIAKFVDNIPGSAKNVGGVSSSWTKIFSDAEVILYREIDYRAEAENAIRFSEDFGLTLGGKAIASPTTSKDGKNLPSAADWIRTPYVFEEVSNEKLLVMEFIPSMKITNITKLDTAGVTASDRIDLADALARAYLRQLCCNLFFSTDPHAGEIYLFWSHTDIFSANYLIHCSS
jgi:predicted unusual protein kinase regulating ubiquinone biosynthesis (AarF/ABC1/UbiB family)